MGATSFFEVAQPIERDIFLSITREVLESSLLIMSPFGLPRCIYMSIILILLLLQVDCLLLLLLLPNRQ